MAELSTNVLIVVILITLWTIPWRGYAMWISARRGQKRWFIVFLIVNTAAILEIIYIFLIAKREKKESLDSEPPAAI